MTDEGFDPSGLGRWTEPTRFEVTGERIAEYARATNDPVAAHLAGEVASPVFAIVPVFQSLLEPALEVVPPQLFGRIVHGEQDFRFHRPIRPGDRLVSRGRMLGYRGQPNGTAANVHLECRTENGEPVNDQYVTFFVRRYDAGQTLGELAPDHKFDESLRARPPVAEIAQRVDEDQTFRYGPAAGDPMPIHLDEEAAVQAGLPGIIVHGLCTMAFTSWALLTELAESEVDKLARLAVRFAKPVLPGQELHTRVWAAGERLYAFETTVGDTLVIKDGLAEFRR